MKRIDPYLILLILFSLFAIGPLLAPGYFWGAHDGRHSVYFLFQFDRSIQDGIFYPRWAPDYTFGYGYPMFNIYAPFALYVSQVFHLIGFDFVTATKIVFALAILLSGPSMFGFVKRLIGSSAAAFISGLTYVYFPYHIADIYVRAALEESVALIFLPLALWGFYETVVNPKRLTFVAAAMAYGIMMFTHNGITAYFTPVLGIWVFVLMLIENHKRQTPSFVHRLSSFVRSGLAPLGALFLGIGMVSIFMIPAVLEYQYVRTDQWLENYYNYTNHFVSTFQLFSPKWGFGISIPGPDDGMSFQLGVMPVILGIASLLAIIKNPNNTRRFWIFFSVMTLVVILLMFSIALPIWQTVPILPFAQFPWRLLTLTMISLSVVAGAIVLVQEKTMQDSVTLRVSEAKNLPSADETLGSTQSDRGLSLPTILIGILIVLSSFPYLTAQNILEPKEGPVSILGLFRFQQSAGEMTGSTAWVKEIPDWSNMADVYFAGKKLRTRIDDPDIDPDKLWIGVLPNFAGMKANGERIVYHAQEDTALTFNIFYYPGWQAYLVKPQTTEIIRPLETYVDPDDVLGRVQVKIPAGREQWLMLRFDDTPPRIIGQWISAASILIALGILIFDVRKKMYASRKG